MDMIGNETLTHTNMINFLFLLFQQLLRAASRFKVKYIYKCMCGLCWRPVM